MRVLPVTLRQVLVELSDLDETLALLASLERDPIPGVQEIVPGARTALIRFGPGPLPDLEAVAATLRQRDLSARSERPGQLIEVPVLYDGEDLDEVARLTGLSPDEVIARHTASEFTVAFTGFAPGFGYLVGGDTALHVPRRQTPRTRIPAGAVALAGPFSGVYPQASPGGWQIIGTTPVRMFDLSRDPSSLMQPGARVRFVRLADRAAFEAVAAQNKPAASEPAADCHDGTCLTVTAAPIPAYWQDLGRPGQAAQGVSASGALDRAALQEVNRILGNAPGAAALEIVGGGFSFETDGPAVIALTGAPAMLQISAASGARLSATAGMPVALDAGDKVTLTAPETGVRSYLSARGGFRLSPVLGSASYDTLARIGPPPVTGGARLAILSRHGGPAVTSALPRALPAPSDSVTLDVIMGPRTEWFTQAAIDLLLSQTWSVTPQSNRVGLRLQGESALERIDPAAELPSEGAASGAIQVPHSGQPVLFLADHPLTGGYPVIATVAEHHLDLAAQVPIGASVQFRAIRPFGEIAPVSPAPRTCS